MDAGLLLTGEWDDVMMTDFRSLFFLVCRKCQTKTGYQICHLGAVSLLKQTQTMGSSSSKSKKFHRRRLLSMDALPSTASSYTRQTVLILGCGDSGKSTLCTKWRLWVEMNSSHKLKSTLPQDRAYICKTIKSCLEAVFQSPWTSGVDFGDKIVHEFVTNFSNYAAHFSKFPLSKSLVEKLTKLWQNDHFQSLLFKAFKFTQIQSSLNHFLSDLKRLRDKNFIPMPADLLHCHVKTTGIIDRDFYSIVNKNIQIVEGAGQKVERNKWHGKFRSTDLVCFLCAVSEFNELLYEDSRKNRLADSLECFQKLVEDPELYDSKFVLIFTKTDLFTKKVNYLNSQKVNLVDEFTEDFKKGIKPGSTPDQVLNEIEKVFKQKGGDMLSGVYKVNLIEPKSTQIFNEISKVLEHNQL